MPAIEIRYIGDKPIKTDNVAGTNTVWRGHGDVQPVEAGIAHRLLRHDSVWEAVDADEVPTRDPQALRGADRLDALREQAKAAGVEVTDSMREDALIAAIDAAKAAPPKVKTDVQKVAELDALREQAKSLGVDVKGTWREARLLTEIAAAEAAKAAAGDERA